jgi:hypothetical protein
MNSFLSFFGIRGVLLSILSEYICILFQVSLVYSYLLLGELEFGYETMSSWGSITFFVPALTDVARLSIDSCDLDQWSAFDWILLSKFKMNISLLMLTISFWFRSTGTDGRLLIE